MFIELVDDLRCPRAHEETWLVASADRVEGRDIIEGTLGCPVCRAEYPVRGGVVWFDQTAGGTESPASVGDVQHAMRMAAFLDLSEARGLALLAGAFGPLADLLRDVVPAHVVALNPTVPVAARGGVSALVIRAGIPLADGTCRGVALDVAHADASHMAEAVRVLLPRGRLVAPAGVPLPSGVNELARDEQIWVAERSVAPPKLVTLRGRGGAG